MPVVNHLTVENLRILEQAHLELAPGANLVVGPNASGKTSLLEALHLLGRGRSFRESQWSAIIREGKEMLRVVGGITSGGRQIVIGMERDREQSTIKIGGERQRGTKGMVEWLPLQLVHADSHRLVEQGPSYRRQFLDWGVFHVEPRFFPAWQRYRRALRQRNAVLRERGDEALLEPWEYELSASAGEIDDYRRSYVENLGPVLGEFAQTLMRDQALGLRYQRGWRDAELVEVLRQSREADRHQGYTRAGPHRADLDLTIDHHRAAQRVSRGQQKLLVFVLILAQARLLKDITDKKAVLLSDDIGSELDEKHLNRLWSCLMESGSQVVVTGTDLERRLALDGTSNSVFHVKHGEVSRVL